MPGRRLTVSPLPKPFSCWRLGSPSGLALYDLSQLLQTGLDKQTLSICVGMIESGANPDTLAVGVFV